MEIKIWDQYYSFSVLIFALVYLFPILRYINIEWQSHSLWINISNIKPVINDLWVMSMRLKNECWEVGSKYTKQGKL